MELIEDNILFNQIKLIEVLEIELNATSDNFRQAFERNVMGKQVSYGLTRPKSEFQGKIKRNSFKIFRTYSVLNTDVAGAEGTYHELGSKLKVTVWVYLPLAIFVAFYLIILVINILLIYQLLTSEFFMRDPIPFLVGIVVFALWTMSFPYLTFRKQIKKLKYDLERDIHFWFRDTNDTQ